MTKTSRFITGIIFIGLLAGGTVAYIKKQSILDALALRNYAPNQRVVSLADDTTMKDNTRRVFYVNHPEINDKASFKQNCHATEQSIVLGCYVQHKGIYLLDVTDPRLEGVMQVTSAHEVLHAEYDRLSKSERTRVDQMTASFYASLDNDRIKKTIDQYAAKDSSIVPNELHSILASEVRNLSPELETYYARYFNDRAKVVDFSEKYEQTFVDLTNQVEAYDEQLKELKATIDSNQLEIEGQSRDIESKKAQLEAMLSADKTAEYNEAVPDYNAVVNSYNALIGTTRKYISEYNEIVEKRNAIATTEQQLVEAINSNVIPKETQ